MGSGEIDLVPGKVFDDEELVVNAKLNALARPSLRVKAASVTTRELADGAINADKLDLDLATQATIEDGEVTTAKLAEGAVTGPKFQDEVTLKNPSIRPAGALDAGVYRPAGVIYETHEQIWYTNQPNGQRLFTLPIPAGLLAKDGDAVRATIVMQVENPTPAGKYMVVYLSGSAGTVDIGHLGDTIYSARFIWEVWVARGGADYQFTQVPLINLPFNRTLGPMGCSNDCAAAMQIYFDVAGPYGGDMLGQAALLEFLPAP